MTPRAQLFWLSLSLFAAACGVDHEVLSRSAADGAAGSAGTSPSGAGGGAAGSAGTSASGTGGSAGTTQTQGFAARALDTSDYGTCAIVGGNAWCWGGQGDEPNPGVFKSSPAQVVLSEVVTSLAAGATHFCALTQTGVVYCWGSNSAFQLGSADANAAGPVRVPLLGKAREVQAGGEHSCAIIDDGTLWCWGDNAENQLGQADLSILRLADPVQVGSGRDWHDLALGQAHSCGLRGTGTLWCWGRNTHSQLGLGAGQPGQAPAPTRVGTASDWLTLSADQEGSCGIRSDQHVYCWGGNIGGRTGVAGVDTVHSPTLVAEQTTFGRVDTGTFHTCATAQNADLYCWGRNIEGQLGLGTSTSSESPIRLPNAGFSLVRVGRFHSCALDQSAKVFCTGKNDTGQLGLGDTTRRSALTQVPDPQ